MSRRRGATFGLLFVSSLEISTTNVAQNCIFVLFKKVYFIKFKLFSSPKSTKKFECWPRPVHPISVQQVIPSCNSPSTYDFLLCVTLFCLPILASVALLSVCLSIPLSVSLPSVSRTVRPLKLLVYLSACLSAGISVLMLGCRLHNYCLFARPYVRISLVLSFLYRPTQSNL